MKLKFEFCGFKCVCSFWDYFMFQYFCVLSQLYSCVLTLNITCMHQRAAICGVLKSLLNILA